MRNLKKFLALVLAMMMVFSLMVTANAATNFVDDAKISDEHRQAVEVLAGLGVLKGDEGGLRPDQPISRAEFAIILYRVATGDVEGTKPALNAMEGVDSPFTDVNDDNYGWAAKWINYAHSMGWLVGNGDGTYAPEENVSVYAVMTGLLRVLGQGAGIGGDNWEFQAATKATEIGIADNIKSFLGAAKREVVGQLAFDSMTYSPSNGTYVYVVSEEGEDNVRFDNSYDAYFYAAAAENAGDRVVTVVTVYEDTLFNTAFNGEIDDGVIIASPDTNPTNAEDGTVTLSGGLNNTYVGEADLGLIGHKVRVYYFDNAKNEHVIYAVVDKATLVAEANLTSSNTLEKAAKAAGFKANTADAATTGLNYVLGNGHEIGTTSHVIMISNSENNKVDYVIEKVRTVAVIDSISTRTVNGETIKTYATKTGNGGATTSYVSTYVVTSDDLARGDVIHIMEIDVDGDKASDLTYIEKAEVLTGTFNGTSYQGTQTQSNKYFHLDGVRYRLSGNDSIGTDVYATIGGVRFVQDFTPESDNVGKAYNFVLNDFGRIAALSPIDEVNNRGYAYLGAFGQGPSTDALGNEEEPALLALLYFPDGTSETVELDTWTQTNINGKTNVFYDDEYLDTDAGKWKATKKGVDVTNNLVFAVTINSDGTYLLTWPDTWIQGVTYGEIKTNVVGSVGTGASARNYYANAQSVTFVVSGKYRDNGRNTLKVTPVIGATDLIGATLTSGYYTTVNNLYIYTVGVSAPYGVGDTTVYYYTGNYTSVYDSANTRWVTTYEAYLNGVRSDITWNKSGTTAPGAATYVTPGLVTIASGGNLVAYDGGWAVGYVKEYYEGYLTVVDSANKVYTVALGSTEVWDISKEGFTAFDESGRTTYVALVYQTINGVARVQQVYVTKVQSNDDQLLPVQRRAYTTEDATGSIYVTVNNDTHTITVTKEAGAPDAFYGLLLDMNLLPSGAKLYKVSSGSEAAGDLTKAMLVGDKDGVGVDTEISSGDKVCVLAEDGVTIQHYTITVTT